MGLENELTTKEKLKAFVSGAPKGLVYGMAVVGAVCTANGIGEALNERLGTSYMDETLIYGGMASAVAYSAYRAFRAWRNSKKGAQERTQP